EIDLSEYRDVADAYGPLGRFLDDVSNRKRIRSSPGDLNPAEFEQPWLTERKLPALKSPGTEIAGLRTRFLQQCVSCAGTRIPIGSPIIIPQARRRWLIRSEFAQDSGCMKSRISSWDCRH